MTTITVYRSDDTSAPSLTGQVGSLTTVLDAILVNGYGSKSAAGWAILYTATNKRVYQAPSGSGNRFPLQVDDANTLSAGANYARTVAYESMTSITAGTAPVPTAAQVSGGNYIQKSITADSTVRPWWCVATNNFFYFMAEAGSTVITSNDYRDQNLFFGDVLSQRPSDGYGTVHFAQSTGANSVSLAGVQSSGSWTAQLGHFIMRPYTNVGSSAAVLKLCATRTCASHGVNFGSDSYAPNFPDPVNGGMNLAETFVSESGGGVIALDRGKLPGFYDLQHNAASLATAFNHLDTIAGAGAYSGNTYLLVRLPNGSASTQGYAAIQIVGTWS